MTIPPPQSPPVPAGPEADETALFKALQAGFAAQFRRVFDDPKAPRTVLVVPSLTLDQDVLARISGFTHYEERMLCLLLLLRLPRTRVIFVTSQPVPPAIVDYYLQLLPGVPREHALRRLTLLACHDGSARPLTEKILERPRLMRRIAAEIPDPAAAHMTCFNVDAPERRLAVALGLPIYGCDPDLLPLGSKSGSRAVFREAGLPMADGFEDLGDAGAVAEALAELKARNPGLRRAVVKLNEGFSGEGNAILRFDGAPEGAALLPWLRERLPRLDFAAQSMTWEEFSGKIGAMGAIVEAFIEGRGKRSPSAQCRIDPTGKLEVISTHDQVTDPRSGQIFLGCRFPADRAYRMDIQAEGMKAGAVLARHGVVGRFGVDFVSVPDAAGDRALQDRRRPAALLLRLRQSRIAGLPGAHRRGSDRHRRRERAAFPRRTAGGRGVPPDRRAVGIRQAGGDLRRRVARRGRAALPRDRRGAGPRGPGGRSIARHGALRPRAAA